MTQVMKEETKVDPGEGNYDRTTRISISGGESLSYTRYGLLHREDGPAYTVDVGNSSEHDMYHLFGELVNKEDYDLGVQILNSDEFTNADRPVSRSISTAEASDIHNLRITGIETGFRGSVCAKLSSGDSSYIVEFMAYEDKGFKMFGNRERSVSLLRVQNDIASDLNLLDAPCFAAEDLKNAVLALTDDLVKSSKKVLNVHDIKDIEKHAGEGDHLSRQEIIDAHNFRLDQSVFHSLFKEKRLDIQSNKRVELNALLDRPLIHQVDTLPNSVVDYVNGIKWEVNRSSHINGDISERLSLDPSNGLTSSGYMKIKDVVDESFGNLDGRSPFATEELELAKMNLLESLAVSDLDLRGITAVSLEDRLTKVEQEVFSLKLGAVGGSDAEMESRGLTEPEN